MSHSLKTILPDETTHRIAALGTMSDTEAKAVLFSAGVNSLRRTAGYSPRSNPEKPDSSGYEPFPFAITDIKSMIVFRPRLWFLKRQKCPEDAIVFALRFLLKPCFLREWKSTGRDIYKAYDYDDQKIGRREMEWLYLLAHYDKDNDYYRIVKGGNSIYIEP